MMRNNSVTRQTLDEPAAAPDAVLLVVDVLSGVTPADQEVAQILRRNQQVRNGQPWPPVLLVVNKADSQKSEPHHP